MVSTRLKGIKEASAGETVLPVDYLQDINQIVAELENALGESLDHFRIPDSALYSDRRFCAPPTLKLKLNQIISYLEHVHHVSEKIIEIGSIYNSIRDEELKARCSDLLSAPGNFDRVINQATLVLEDRIRTKSGNGAGLTGVQLVNTVLKTDPADSVLVVATDPGEHEGFCHICRGMMQAFRNPTHHELSDRFSREDALKLCAFVDNLLQVIDGAEVRSA